MPRYLISFDCWRRTPPPKIQTPAALAFWATACADGTITDGPVPETKAVVGGFSIIEVSSREEALAWAARFAKACRCAQEVREIMYDPES